MSDDADLIRHRLWVAEQEEIARRRADARRLLDGDPEARRLLEERWAPVTATDPDV